MATETAAEKLRRREQNSHEEEMKRLQRNAVKKLGTLISDNIITIFFVILAIAIVIAIIGLIFWFNLTDGVPTDADKSRWEGYKEFLGYINSHVIVSLLTIIFMKIKPQNKQ